MSSSHRAFSQRISKLHAAELRRTVSAVTEGKNPPRSASVSTVSSINTIQEINEPVDYEDFIEQHQTEADRDPARQILYFPYDDIKVNCIPRQIRTLEPTLFDSSQGYDAHVEDCIRCYTKDYVHASRQYIHYSSSIYSRNNLSGDKWQHLQPTPTEYEVDLDEEKMMDDSDRGFLNSQDVSSSHHSTISDTPRGSWASSVCDLRNSVGDPLLPNLLSRTSQDTIDSSNFAMRQESRQESLLLLYPNQEEEDMIERRIYPEMPQLHLGHKIMVKCISLKLELEIEPIFASMCLYDIKEKKKVSENFYFDMNQEPLKRMLNSHIPFQDISTLSRAAIFEVTYPSSDLFLVVRLEKVLQGDISDVLSAYMKDDYNKDKLKTSAVAFCERLGKYRMPFAWTAINLVDIVQGNKDAVSERDSISSNNSLDRKQSASSFDDIKRRGGSGSLTRRGSLERRSFNEKRRSWSPEEFGACLTSFHPITLTVSTFFKQEGDKLRDEDLFKFLPELKRTSSQLKKKCLPGNLVLDISPVKDTPKYCLTSELDRVHPYPDEKCRPIKEVLEFPPQDIYIPHSSYRNLLFVSPKELNFSNRPGSARNIAVKVQFMGGEGEVNATSFIFGRSSCPEYSTEAYTTVTYHNKSPDFYDEFKIKLPAALNDHHLLFTFYHISCQKKTEEKLLETPVGYTWLPVCMDGSLRTGEHCLPVMMEPPPSNYSYITADIQLPGTKWVDNHKGIFTVFVDAISTVHAQDTYLDKFFHVWRMMKERNIPARIGEAKMEGELKKAINEIYLSQPEPLVNFLPVVFDRLINLMVRPPIFAGQSANLAQTTFHAIADIVEKISKLLEMKNDQHGRNSILLSYIGYQASLPHPENMASPPHPIACPRPPEQSDRHTSMQSLNVTPSHRRSTSNPDLGADADSEVSNLLNKGLDRTNSMRIGSDYANLPSLQRHPGRKLVHEELAFQWVVSSSPGRETALRNAWFFFELMIKSMCEHLAQTCSSETPRKLRFSLQFCDDIETLVNMITNDIIAFVNKEVKNIKVIQSINSSLAFFLCDLLSIMDRGFIFNLIRNYCRQTNSKVSCLPDPNYLINLKLDFVRIVCSHEHYIALNLPFCTPLSNLSAPSSPCPSISSTNSQSSFISTIVGGDKAAFMTLSTSFCQQHFLSGLVLTDLAAALELNNPCVHGRSVNTIRNLLTVHDSDERYTHPDVRARVASLYLPLIHIVVEALPQLFAFSSPRYHLQRLHPQDDPDAPQPHIHQNVAIAIAQSSVFGSNQQESEYDILPGQTNKCSLSSETSRNLLICLLWILKNVDDITLRQSLLELSANKLQHLLEVLYIAVSCFEYKGSQQNARNRDLALLPSHPHMAFKPALRKNQPRGLEHHTQSLQGSPCPIAYGPSEAAKGVSLLGDGRPPIPPPPPMPPSPHSSSPLRGGRKLSSQGKKSTHKTGIGNIRNKAEMRSRLEEAIMGQNSARSEMMLRRRAERNPPSPSTAGTLSPLNAGSSATIGGERLRWRKEAFSWKSQSMLSSTHSQDGDRVSGGDIEHESQVEANLASESNMIILDTLENIVQVATQSDHLQGLLSIVLKVLLHCLSANQSTSTLTNMFNTQRSLVSKFPSLLFDDETEQCADLCLQLLKHCSSCICTVRSHAAASLYLLMRHNFEIGNNFARVKMQVTMSLSSLVGTSQTFNEAFLRRSLRTILTYAEEDKELQDTSFPEQVKDLVFNLHMILSDTVKMKEYQEDPEMLLDLMYRIARGYQNSPDLRLTWLANMAQKHSERGQHAEAAMCLVHSGALVSEYLYMLEDRPHLPIGAVTFNKISPNVLEESAVSDDVLSPDEEGICTGKYFSENGLVGLLEQASSSFTQAGLFECINEVYKVLIPVAEKARNWKKLINIHTKVSEAFTNIDRLEGKRIFGTYFRVGFYGAKFGDLDGEEFVYKEPTLTKLPEISHRLESFYSERFGTDNFEIIKDSNTVNSSKLNSEKAYIQITYVEPYFDVCEEEERATSFEKNYNIKRFIFSTPFTPDGRAHGELHEQYKRKTVLITQHMFPYIKTRVQVVQRYWWILTPIEVAIEDIQKKTQELHNAIKQEPPDHKILQMVLQGCIGTTVNQGPMEVALVFLSELPSGKKPDRFQNKLRLCFKDFSRNCHDALKKNKSLIGPDMREYQRELERNYHRFTERLAPMIILNGAYLSPTSLEDDTESDSSGSAETLVSSNEGEGADDDSYESAYESADARSLT